MRTQKFMLHAALFSKTRVCAMRCGDAGDLATPHRDAQLMVHENAQRRAERVQAAFHLTSLLLRITPGALSVSGI